MPKCHCGMQFDPSDAKRDFNAEFGRALGDDYYTEEYGGTVCGITRDDRVEMRRDDGTAADMELPAAAEIRRRLAPRVAVGFS
jgi:hypothetical protein